MENNEKKTNRIGCFVAGLLIGLMCAICTFVYHIGYMNRVEANINYEISKYEEAGSHLSWYDVNGDGIIMKEYKKTNVES